MKAIATVQAAGPVSLTLELSCDGSQPAPAPIQAPGPQTPTTFEVNGPLPAELLANSDWYKRIDGLPAHPLSAEIIQAQPPVVASLGRRTQNDWGPDLGMPYSVGSGHPVVPINITSYPAESDHGPFPIPLTAPIEGGDDKHLLYFDTAGVLYEMFVAAREGAGFTCGSAAKFLRGRSDDQRPLGYTSADAAGLAILPGLVKYDEMKAALAKTNPADQHLGHALRFTLPRTGKGFISPARHYTSNHGAYSLPSLPPMGMRIRVKGGFDLSPFNQPTQVLLRTLQLFGALLADNGASYFIGGTRDSRWSEYFEAITGNVDGKRGFKSFAGAEFDANVEVVAFSDADVVTQV